MIPGNRFPLRTSLAATLLVAVLFSFAVHGLSHRLSLPPGTTTYIAEGPVDQITLLKTGSFPLYFIRKENRWHLALDRSTSFPLNTVRFSAFLEELSRDHVLTDTGIRDHRIHSTGDRAEYRIESRGPDGENKTIAFGDGGAAERFRYVSFGDMVYRTDNGIQPFLDIRTASWIDHRPFDPVFDKTGLQRAVLSQNGSTLHIFPENALPGLQRALKGLYCIDVTNIPGKPDLKLLLELGNLETLTLGFSRLSEDYVIMSETRYGASWILSAETMGEIIPFPVIIEKN